MGAASTTTQVPGVGLAVLLVTILGFTACTGGGNHDEPASPTEGVDQDRHASEADDDLDGPAGRSDPVVLNRWVGDDLPPVASRVTVAGDIGVYYSDIDRQLHIVAIDLNHGTELWRERADTHGRSFEQYWHPIVDAGRGLVVVPAFEGDTAVLLGLDLGTGDWLWGEPTVWFAHHPVLCGAAGVCGSSLDGEVILHSRNDGEVQGYDPDSHPVSLAWTAGLRVGLDPESGAVDIEHFSDLGWIPGPTVEVDDLVPSELAGWFGRDGASHAWVDAASRNVLLEFLPRHPSGEDSIEHWIAELEAGDLVALIDTSGAPLMATTGVQLCSSARWWNDIAVLCDDLHRDPSRERSDNETARPAFHRLTVLGLDNGETLATIELPPDPLNHGDRLVLPTSSPHLGVLRIRDDSFVVDLDAESVVAASESSGRAVTPCQRPFGEIDPIRIIELDTWYGEQYFRTVEREDLTGLCLLDETPIDPEDWLVESGQLPEWFGIADPATGHQPTEWDFVVWADDERRLHGLVVQSRAMP